MICKHCLVWGGRHSRYCVAQAGRVSHVWLEEDSEECRALLLRHEIKWRLQSEFECPSCGMARPGLTEQEQQEELGKPCGNPKCPSHGPAKSLSDSAHYAREDARSLDSIFRLPQGTMRLIERLEEVIDGHGFARPSMALASTLWRLTQKQPSFRSCADREMSEIVLGDGGRSIETKVRLFPMKRQELGESLCQDCEKPLSACRCKGGERG